MRQSIGNVWLIQIMVIFILLFAGYIILTLNYSKTIKVKNELVSIIEKYEGLNENSIELLNSYLLANTYVTTGSCAAHAGVYGATDYSVNELEPVTDPKAKYLYCVKKYKGAKTSNYYQITVFYKFNLPILGYISSFTVKGTTGNFQAKDLALYGQAVDGSVSGVGGSGGGSPTGGGSSGGGTSGAPTPTYTVSFDLNGGSGSIPSQNVKQGYNVVKPPSNPTRSGYTFVEWQYNGSAYNFGASVNSDITLKAKWIATGAPTDVYHTVSFNLDGGTSKKKDGVSSGYNTQIAPKQVLSGETVAEPNKPYKYSPHATFDGWLLNGKPYDFSTPVTSDITLTAKWVNKVRIYFNYGACGLRSYNEDNGDEYINTNGTRVMYLDVNSKIGIGKYEFKSGPDYGDNDENNQYNWTYTFGYNKPITGWITLSGALIGVDTPITSDMNEMVLTAKC